MDIVRDYLIQVIWLTPAFTDVPVVINTMPFRKCVRLYFTDQWLNLIATPNKQVVCFSLFIAGIVGAVTLYFKRGTLYICRGEVS